ncbi:MAG TPA: hypothetical protein VHM88_02550 [Candidatus Acidoferrales bacterium]|jgi:hypothetical protein|nr:hypothetical protein [Candidatus Acidoferrales bacterium]
MSPTLFRATDAEVDSAIARAKAAEQDRPKAIAAVYRLADDPVVITLATGGYPSRAAWSEAPARLPRRASMAASGTPAGTS